MKVTGFIKSCAAGWVTDQISKQAGRKGVKPPHKNVVMGLMDDKLRRWIHGGEDFIYLDHAYFQRGWEKNNLRAIRNACHLSVIKPRPDDRMKKFGIVVEPWRKERGSKIVVIPTYAGHHRIWPEMVTWVDTIQAEIKKLTDRPIAVKHEKGGFRAYLEDAWCVVCNQSVAGVEAALMGVPVFSEPRCPSYPVSNKLENIENPEFFDFRHDWAASLAYATWNASEIDTVDWLDYDYSLRNDLS